jgi:hypothetical protein
LSAVLLQVVAIVLDVPTVVSVPASSLPQPFPLADLTAVLVVVVVHTTLVRF